MDGRYSANFVVFDIANEAYSQESVNAFANAVNAKDLVVMNPSVTNNNRYRCYCTRNNNAKFNLTNGVKSLAKKMRVAPKVPKLEALCDATDTSRETEIVDRSKHTSLL